MAAIRLNGDADNIESTLSLALVDSASTTASNKSIIAYDPLASSTWEQVIFCVHKSKLNDCLLSCFGIFGCSLKLKEEKFINNTVY